VFLKNAVIGQKRALLQLELRKCAVERASGTPLVQRVATDAAALYYFVPVWGQRLVELGAKLLNLIAIRPDHGVQHL
jgi:hypothetical protein